MTPMVNEAGLLFETALSAPSWKIYFMRSSVYSAEPGVLDYVVLS